LCERGYLTFTIAFMLPDNSKVIFQSIENKETQWTTLFSCWSTQPHLKTIAQMDTPHPKKGIQSVSIV